MYLHAQVSLEYVPFLFVNIRNLVFITIFLFICSYTCLLYLLLKNELMLLCFYIFYLKILYLLNYLFIWNVLDITYTLILFYHYLMIWSKLTKEWFPCCWQRLAQFFFFLIAFTLTSLSWLILSNSCSWRDGRRERGRGEFWNLAFKYVIEIKFTKSLLFKGRFY